jgi:hypothetical protein
MARSSLAGPLSAQRLRSARAKVIFGLAYRMISGPSPYLELTFSQKSIE